MNDSPLRTFGFAYEHDGKRYMIDLEATSADEAMRKLSSLAAATCVGEIAASDSTSDEVNKG